MSFSFFRHVFIILADAGKELREARKKSASCRAEYEQELAKRQEHHAARRWGATNA